jgi:hypothetical protein
MTGSRLTIFSIVYGVLYFVSFYYDLALFRYYPEVGQFHFLRNDRLGVVILWYGWIATSALASACIAFAVPRKMADRLGPGWAWIIPTAVVVGMLIYERRWFVS